jgi:hypothetical protein
MVQPRVWYVFFAFGSARQQLRALAPLATSLQISCRFKEEASGARCRMALASFPEGTRELEILAHVPDVTDYLLLEPGDLELFRELLDSKGVDESYG